MSGELRCIFITGATGYMGRQVVSRLLERGHQVRALIRPGSEAKLPSGCEVIVGKALDHSTYTGRVQPADTFVQLVGVSHPSPAKAAQFRSVDLASALNSVSAAVDAGVEHFVYVSVAQPAPVMKAYVQARMEGEQAIRASGLNATILRPWYVLGPGHRWPYLLLPMYRLLELLPATREGVQRLGLVTLEQMTGALLDVIEHPCRGVRVVEVPEIRALGKKGAELSPGIA